MKNRIQNNLSLKLLSVVIAFVIWMIVVNYDNPYVTRTISGIPIEIINEETLTNNDMVYTLAGPATASVRVRCPRKLAHSLKISDFRAEADFNNMYTLTNQVPITITCNHMNVANDEITCLTPSLQIELEDILTKKMDVVVNAKGTPEKGYRVGEMTASPSTVTVRAPQSFLDQISYVGVEVNVEGVSQTVMKLAELQFYNAGGNVMDSSEVKGLHVSYTDIHAEVEILNVKTVSLDYTVTGQDAVADGYLYSGIEINPGSIEISGRKTTLADISVLRIPDGELDVSGADSNIEKTFDARELLPDGVTLVNSEDAVITVILKIERQMTKEFLLDSENIKVENLKEDYKLEFVKGDISVTIQGLISDLEALSPEEIISKIDLEDYGLGLHYVTLDIEVPHGFRVIGEPRVRVRVFEPSEESLTAAGNPSEEEEEGASDSPVSPVESSGADEGMDESVNN